MSLQVINGKLTVTMKSNSLYTFTTVIRQPTKNYDEPPAPKPFPLPYTEDFECQL